MKMHYDNIFLPLANDVLQNERQITYSKFAGNLILIKWMLKKLVFP